jgi:hypothetical protein
VHIKNYNLKKYVIPLVHLVIFWGDILQQIMQIVET